VSHGVFIYKEGSIYDDSPAVRYHFPRQYLERARAFVGDWIVYYEPIKERASRGYWAVARVSDITSDPSQPGMYYAWIDPGSFLQFSTFVPRMINGEIVESGLANAQWSIRPLSNDDFSKIIRLGLPDEDDLLPRAMWSDSNTLKDNRLDFDFGDRARQSRLLSRPVRDRAFRRSVLRAYGERCAITGLKLINGGGRAEVEAAHIQSVADNGPDMVANGLALSGTIHWAFDRGLISLDDSLEIIVSRHINDRGSIEALINADGHARLPADIRERPHPAFLKWHREHCLKR
jgi:putative restriction endonuclease